MKNKPLFLFVLVTGFLFTLAGCATAKIANGNSMMIREQGSFAAGGAVIRSDGTFDPRNIFTSGGMTYHGDHATVFYQIPENARELPIVFLHGASQSMRTWQTTPDGREGFQNIFLKRGFSVYLVDQPRRGQSGRSNEPITITPVPDDQIFYSMIRLGRWPNFFPGVQFPQNDEESLNQYYRQMTPNTGPYSPQVISDAMAAVFEKSGPSILVTHSQGGGPGWHTAIKSDKVRAIISYEPGSGFVFPIGEAPETMPSGTGNLAPEEIPLADFLKLTRIPIIIYYGDNIPADFSRPSEYQGEDNWRVRLEMAKRWAEAVNRHGGDAQVVHLPELGVFGNTHFPFSDLNNIQIADLMSGFLREKNLDNY
jgi:pimeloyl-ACP methyl ester carboxylesterase